MSASSTPGGAEVGEPGVPRLVRRMSRKLRSRQSSHTILRRTMKTACERDIDGTAPGGNRLASQRSWQSHRTEEYHPLSWPCGQQSRPKKRYYAEARLARRGNALLRQTGSTAGPVLWVEKACREGDSGATVQARRLERIQLAADLSILAKLDPRGTWADE
jgi:hypothetical protein